MNQNKLPTITPYGEYSSDNYGANALKVSFPNLALYYSYKTIVAFSTCDGLVVTENDWSTTTGKHLNWIDGGSTQAKRDRLPRARFEQELTAVLKEHNLI